MKGLPRTLFVSAGLCVIMSLLWAAVAGQTAIPVSDALVALAQQADQYCARHFGATQQQLLENDPEGAAVCLGLAMHGQFVQVVSSPVQERRFKALRLEVFDFLNGLAEAHGNRNPRDGNAMNGLFLCTIFDSNASGAQNSWAVQNGLPDPGRAGMPMILSRVSAWSIERVISRS